MAGQTPGSAGGGLKQVFTTAIDETATYDKEGIGTHRWVGNNCYKWVLFNNGAGDVASIAGDCAYYYGVSGDAVTGGYETNTVTMDRTDAYMGAGLFQAVIADASYGWIQIKGPATMTQALTAGADGNALTHTGAGADGALDVSAAVTDAVVAYATDASAKKIVCDFPW